MTTIAFVRHGNTDWNIENRIQGHTNNPLNKTGLKQAKIVAQRLSNEGWDVIVASDLLRARQTAEIISSDTEIPIAKFDKRLRERTYGKIEGTIEEDRVKKWGKNWSRLDLGEETYKSLRNRGTNVVQDITLEFPEKNVLIVSHGLMITETLNELFGTDEGIDDLVNTSVTKIKKLNKDWEYLLYNCTHHIKSKELISL